MGPLCNEFQWAFIWCMTQTPLKIIKEYVSRLPLDNFASKYVQRNCVVIFKHSHQIILFIGRRYGVLRSPCENHLTGISIGLICGMRIFSKEFLDNFIDVKNNFF